MRLSLSEASDGSNLRASPARWRPSTRRASRCARKVRVRSIDRGRRELEHGDGERLDWCSPPARGAHHWKDQRRRYDMLLIAAKVVVASGELVSKSVPTTMACVRIPSPSRSAGVPPTSPSPGRYSAASGRCWKKKPRSTKHGPLYQRFARRPRFPMFNCLKKEYSGACPRCLTYWRPA